MTLENWFKSGWLKNQDTNEQEIASLLEKIDRDIKESKIKEISLDWRLAIAYNASLGCANVALRIKNYRIPAGAGQHYRTIQSLRFTINPDPDIILSLESISKKRAIVNYDAAGTISEVEVKEAISLAEDLRKALIVWIAENYPDYSKL